MQQTHRRFVVADGSAQVLRRFFKFLTRFYRLVVDSNVEGRHDGARKHFAQSLG